MVSPKRKRGIHSSKRDARQNMREMLQPSMGFRAMGRWFILKMVRQSQDPHKIAGGAALGTWINFLPIPGFGGVVAIIAAYFLRLSVPVAFIAQTPSNPLTFPLLWWISYVTGLFVMPIEIGGIGFHTLMQNFNWPYFMEHWWELLQGTLLTMFIGGQVLGIPLAIIVYKVMYRQVDSFWDKRRARQAKQRELEAAFQAFAKPVDEAAETLKKLMEKKAKAGSKAAGVKVAVAKSKSKTKPKAKA